MPDTVINGVSLHWQRTGETGDPLVLVHGSWGDLSQWGTIVPTLARSFRVLAYDRRGHSRSTRPAAQGSVREDVADLAGLIEHLDLAPAHVLGNSFGGVISLRLAAEHAGLVRSVLVHEPPLFGLLEDSGAGSVLDTARERTRAVLDLLESGRMEEGARLFMETVAFGPGAWPEFPDEVRETFVFNAPTFLDEERDPESRTVDLQRLAAFRGPALLTYGDRSAPFFRRIVEKLAEGLPNARKQTLTGAGHVPHMTGPEEYVGTIESFLGSSGSAPLP